jgi:voltage-gated potassium channel
MLPEKRVKIFILGLAVVIIVGVSGYHLIEGWSIFDSLYMTVITITTVGYGEVKPLSKSGKLFTVFLIIFGISTIVYGIESTIEYFISFEFRNLFRRRRMEKEIEKLKEHYIVCGFGRVGENVCKEFLKQKVPFVVVENNEKRLSYLSKTELLYVVGDASEERVLKEAGIERAKGLVAALSSDADNVFVILTAKFLNPKILVVARCIEKEAEYKLRKAGADEVISPYAIGGERIAQAILELK